MRLSHVNGCLGNAVLLRRWVEIASVFSNRCHLGMKLCDIKIIQYMHKFDADNKSCVDMTSVSSIWVLFFYRLSSSITFTNRFTMDQAVAPEMIDSDLKRRGELPQEDVIRILYLKCPTNDASFRNVRNLKLTLHLWKRIQLEKKVVRKNHVGWRQSHSQSNTQGHTKCHIFVFKITIVEEIEEHMKPIPSCCVNHGVNDARQWSRARKWETAAYKTIMQFQL